MVVSEIVVKVYSENWGHFIGWQNKTPTRDDSIKLQVENVARGSDPGNQLVDDPCF